MCSQKLAERIFFDITDKYMCCIISHIEIALMDEAHVQCMLFLPARFAYELSVVCSAAVSHCAVMCQSSVTARQIYLQIAKV